MLGISSMFLELQPLDPTQFTVPLNTCGCSIGVKTFTPVEQQKPVPEFTDEVPIGTVVLLWCACLLCSGTA